MEYFFLINIISDLSNTYCFYLYAKTMQTRTVIITNNLGANADTWQQRINVDFQPKYVRVNAIHYNQGPGTAAAVYELRSNLVDGPMCIFTNDAAMQAPDTTHFLKSFINDIFYTFQLYEITGVGYVPLNAGIITIQLDFTE